MKKLSILALLLLVSFAGFTQGPVKAIGLRGGISSGFEYRVFSGDLVSYKVLLSTRKQGIQLTGMKEFHVPDAFEFNEDLSFIYGFGAHVGFESWYVDRYYDDIYNNEWYRDRKTGPVAGLDALAAVEYTIPQIPLVVGIEAKPYFNLFGKNFFQLQPFDFAFTLKYTF
ncbi:MAG: hypothetical protein JNK09_13670 [Prolixibacteraceae bacterium]|nr:hypothetical protein [Prolixibacteraceae bacterium]